MTEKKPAHQISMFRQDIPKMQEGYYSSGPNPNLRKFIDEHATPYELETDTYNVPPFDKPIKTTKTTSIYNIHNYWSKKPHDAIQEYIIHYTQPGNIVLDPFCGSGSTALSALIEGRNAIAIDLSPAATFISSSYLNSINPTQILSATKTLEYHLKRFLSETVYDESGSFIKAIVYTERFICSKCRGVVPFIKHVEGDVRKFRGRQSKKECCPFCGEPINTTKDERLGFVPAELHLSDKPTSTRYKTIDVYGNEDIAKRFPTKPNSIPDWLHFPFEGYIPPRLSKNLSKAGVDTVGELFSDLNLRVLLEIWNGIDIIDVDNDAKKALRLAFNAILLNSSRMYRHRVKTTGGGGFSGTYYIPHMSKCMNPWSQFLSKIKSIGKGIGERNKLLHGDVGAIVSTESATEFYKKGQIPENSIDYIFTDPPYGGTYHYGALNFVWEVWNQMDLSWRPYEIVISEDGSITKDDWIIRMTRSAKEMFAVLKPGRWISICFHGDVDLWVALNDIIAEAGFLPEHRDSVLYVDTNQKSYNQSTGSTSKKRDLIVNFRKPRPGELIRQLALFGDEDSSTFTQKIITILKDALEKYPGSQSDRLYDEIVSRMVRKGEFEAHNFNEILYSIAEEVNGRWYLLETADSVDDAEGEKEISASKRLENYMLLYLKENPGEYGVHYSDIFEQYLPIQDKPRRLMQEWLPEFFYKTTEGTWRPPADEEERAQKGALRTSGTLRRIKRFANALLEGVPPHDRDLPKNLATASEWIRQCRRSGLYEHGRVLYEKGGFNFDALDEEAQLEVQEDYQICVRRSG